MKMEATFSTPPPQKATQEHSWYLGGLEEMSREGDAPLKKAWNFIHILDF